MQQRVRPSVTMVRTEQRCGTGWYYGQHYVITNSHVVTSSMVFMAPDRRIEIRYPAQTITIDLPGMGRPVPVVLVGKDDERDVAVLQLPLDITTPTLYIKDVWPDSLTRVMVVGYPHCMGPVFEFGWMQDVIVNGDQRATSLQVQPGNSGSPVVLPDGTVVGMISTYFPLSGEGNIVPAHDIKCAIEEILSGRPAPH